MSGLISQRRGRVKQTAAGSAITTVSSDNDVDETNLTTYTHTPTLSGVFSHIIVCVAGRRATSGTNSFSSVELNASAMTTSVEVHAGREGGGIFIIASSDTTPSIEIVFGSQQAYSQIVVFGVEGLTSATAIATATATNDPADLDVNTNADGIVFGVGRQRDADGTEVWSNTGFDSDNRDTAQGADGAVNTWWENTTAETPRDLQIDSDITGGNDLYLAASYS